MTATVLCAAASSGDHQSLVVGSVVNGQTSVASLSPRSTPPLNDHTIFRIASLSKVFTATALAVSLKLGEIDIDQAANDYLPDWLRLPETSHPVTVRHLATHTSGLVAVPGAVSIGDAVARLRVEYPPGTRYAYSNLGMSVLAWLIAARAGTEFPILLRQRVCEPLAVADIVVDLDAGQRQRLALGVDQHGGLAPTPTYPDYAGSGGLYGTVADLLRFLQAQLELVPHWLPLELTRRQWFDAGDGESMGLGWRRSTLPRSAEQIVWHSGALPGYRSYLALCVEAGVGIVVLANRSGVPAADIGAGALDSYLSGSL